MPIKGVRSLNAADRKYIEALEKQIDEMTRAIATLQDKVQTLTKRKNS